MDRINNLHLLYLDGRVELKDALFAGASENGVLDSCIVHLNPFLGLPLELL